MPGGVIAVATGTMRRLLRLLLLLLLAVPLMLAALALLALDDSPLVTSELAFTPAHIERAKRILARNDPRRMRPGVLRTVVISQEDLDLAANYLAGRFAHGATRIVLHEGAASVRATFALPANPVGRYVNLDVQFIETKKLPEVALVRIGRVRVPAFLCNWLVRSGLARLQASADYSAAADVIKQVSAAGGVLSVVFEWSDAVTGQLQAALVPAADQARWQVYQARLVELTERSVTGHFMTLDQLLVPLLQLAAQRAANGSAQDENRAALVVLAFYVNGKGLASLVPRARDWPRPVWRIVTLAGRTDFPQHFTISAALAATAGSPLSDAVGLYKEVDDSRRGSGFSFNDFAADRAGTRFGELAVAGQAGATKLYRELAQGLRETDLLPDVRDLPEFLTEAEFKRRFGGIGEPRYLEMLVEIERRLGALPLYR